MPRLSLALCLAAAIPAAAETLDPVNDLRIGVAVQRSPSVHEELAPPSGAGLGDAKGIDWKGAKVFGLRYDALYVHGPSRPRAAAGMLWAVGLSYGQTDITPDSYSTGSGSSDNTRDDFQLKYRQYGAAIGLGWATMPSDTALGDLHWEALGLIRGGWATAQSVAPGLRADRRQGAAPWWEAGIQGGMVLAQDRWVFAVNVSWLYGKSLIDVDYGDGYSSRLTIIRNGPEIGILAGYRF